MPVYTIQTPGGKTLTIEAGSEAEAISGAQSWHAQQSSAEPPKPERSFWDKLARGATMPAAGFNESLATTVGALPDMVGAGMRAVGLPSSKPGQYTDWARQGIQAITGKPPAPENTTERLLHGAGRGVGDAASVFIPATIAARASKAGSVARGVNEALSSQPVMQSVAGGVGQATAEATESPAAGFLASLAVPVGAAVGRRAVTPAPIPDARRPIVDIAEREGIPLSIGQRSDSPPFRWADTVFRNYPTTAGAQGAVDDAARVAFNRAAGSKAGVAADRLTPEVMSGHADDLGRRFEEAASRLTVNLDNTLLNDLQAVTARYGDKLPSQQKPVFSAYINDILNSGNTMGGLEYQVARSDLTRQARAMTRTDPFLGNALRGVRNALDDAAERSMPSPEAARDWSALRREYANFRTIEKALSGAGERVAEGNVSPAMLRQAINQGDPRAYAMGRGDLSDLARLGQVVKDMPQSGTSPQQNMTRLLTMGGVGGGAAGAGAATGIDPMTSAAAALGVPLVMQKAYQSPWVQSYLRNQLFAGSPGTAPGTYAAIMAADPDLRNMLAQSMGSQ